MLRELSGTYDGKAPVPDYLEATVYSKEGYQTLYFTLSIVSLLCSVKDILKARLKIVAVPDHDGGWPEEVNTCFLNSYMVYL